MKKKKKIEKTDQTVEEGTKLLEASGARRIMTEGAKRASTQAIPGLILWLDVVWPWYARHGTLQDTVWRRFIAVNQIKPK